MGFRGEALPSISSVSLMELTTYFEGDKTGTTIRFEGGKQVFLGPAPPRKGTAISVRNLFYNVPARRKFLKSDLSEKRKLSDVIRRYLIAHPEIGFQITHDGKVTSTLPRTESLLERLESVWGNGVTDFMAPIGEGPVGPMSIRGYVSTPEVTRANRNEIFFFVNRRPVLEKSFYGALAAAYGPALPPGRHPFAAVFLDIEPNFVDINVHPAKTEVRFADDGFIFTSLKKALDRALGFPVKMTFPAHAMYSPVTPGNDPARPASILSRPVLEDNNDFKMNSAGIADFKESPIAGTPLRAQTNFLAGSGLFLQLFDTFILVRRDNDIQIIDQHTAHERVLFEKNLYSFDSQGLPSQKMLFEERIRLTPDELDAVEKAGEFFARAGFEIRPFGPDEVIVSGIPQDMVHIPAQEALKETLAVFSSNLRNGQELRRALAAALACKAAVKAGHRLSEAEIGGLMTQLFNCRDPFRCPHGRPTIVVMNRDDLEKTFRRK
jgi:DNA mismatch repair protein MutL